MRKIEFAHEILSESRRNTQIYLESGRNYDKVKANMYSIFECYAHGLITWNQVRTRWHSSIVEYLNLYADRPDLYLSESNRMLGEYETTLQTHKPALDEYKRVNEQKMISNIVVKGKLNESQAKEHSNVYFNRRALTENELKDTATMKTWKRVQESYPNLTSKDELRIRMLTVFEGSTVDTTKLVTTYMSEEPTAISGPMQTSLRPKPRPVTGGVDSASIDSAVQQALGKGTAPTTSLRPQPRPAATQSIGAGSQVTRMANGSIDGSTRGIDPADAYSPEDLARLTGQPAPRSPLAPTTSPRPMPRPTTLKQSANNNIRKEAAAIFSKIKVAANEGYKVLPPMDKERYGEIPGLEGPFTTLSGKVVYYDPKEGAYYDRDTDMYLSNDEYTALNSDYSGMKDERDINVREAKAKPGHNARVMANNLSKVFKAKPDFLDMDKDGDKEEPMKKAAADSKKKVDESALDEAGAFSYGKKPRKGTVAYNAAEQRKKQEKNEKPIEPKDQKVGNAKVTKDKVDEKAKWRSSSAAKKITDPDKDLGMADYDYHHENPRSTGRLKSTADTETEPHSIINRAKSKINSMGKRKGMIGKADIDRVKSNAFNTLNKDKVDETVTLDYSRYMRAHGKKPRDAGMGSSTWMFTTSDFGDPREDEIFQFQGSFADAKKAAAKWAKSQGEYRFYVMEDSNGSVQEAGGYTGVGGGQRNLDAEKKAWAPFDAGVRGAVDNITLGTGKYARAAADYSAKNLGSLAGITDPTSWETEFKQELEKDLAAQTDHPLAWDRGSKAATAAQIAYGGGILKLGAKGLVKGGSAVLAKSAEKKAARELGKRVAKDADATDFELGSKNNFELTPQMRVRKEPLELTPQMKVPKTPPKKPTNGNVLPFPKKP